ncbi:MAG: biotin transporter BioY [Deltaproteobacteria bacterium]|jgi:biotin transport system substrate-specific component|nr:biotin transporter BioY [Deltaproteobacteria bacterium]
MFEEVSLSQTRRLVRLAVWAAFMALGAWVSLPIGPVPITLQTFFIFLAAFVDGPRAALAVLLYLGAGLLGLPVFAGGLAGPALVFGPTAGYALAFPLMALICGLGRANLASLKTKAKAQSTNQKRPAGPALARTLFFGLLGLAFVYLSGSIGLVLNAGFSFGAALALNVTFIPGDAAKVVAAALVAFGLTRSGAGSFSRGEAKQNF